MKHLKLVILCLSLVLLSGVAYSQSQYVGDFLTFTIEERKNTVLEMNPFDSSTKNLEYVGELKQLEPLSVFQCEDGSELYILQSEDIAIIYDGSSNLLYWGCREREV